MTRSSHTSPPKARSWPAWLTIAVVAVALGATVAVGAAMRLEDPTSTTVIPAEDPYNHMALIREHVRDGELDPLYDQGHLYPPGMHAFLATFWVATGLELYEIVRLGPAVLGAIGVLGIGLLLGRSEGWIAGIVGAMALAVAPEAVFRTTMMSPTALDLALIPFLFYAMRETWRGRLAWAGVAAPMAAFLIVAHPWLLAVLTLAGGIFALLAMAFPWSAQREQQMTPQGLAATAAILGTAFAIALYAGPGFDSILNLPAWLDIRLAAGLVLAVGLLPLALHRFAPRALQRMTQREQAAPLWLRGVGSAVIAGTLVAVTVPAVQQGMPSHVDLPRMFGAPILALAVVGLLALPFRATSMGYLGAALAASTFLFVIYNPLASPFWPHRTAVFFGFGLIMLAGVAAGTIARAMQAAVMRAMESRPITSKPDARFGLNMPVALAIGSMFVATSLAGTVFAVTPVNYETGWYRMYNECELDAMREVADSVENDSDAVIITGTWQAKLVVASLTHDAGRVWFDDGFFYSTEHREDLAWSFDREDRDILVVVDKHMRLEHPEADLSFLDQEPWVHQESYCANMGIEQPRLNVYALGEVRS